MFWTFSSTCQCCWIVKIGENKRYDECEIIKTKKHLSIPGTFNLTVVPWGIEFDLCSFIGDNTGHGQSAELQVYQHRDGRWLRHVARLVLWSTWRECKSMDFIHTNSNNNVTDEAEGHPPRVPTWRETGGFMAALQWICIYWDCNWNVPEWTRACCDSLFLVCNGSTIKCVKIFMQKATACSWLEQ